MAASGRAVVGGELRQWGWPASCGDGGGRRAASAVAQNPPSSPPAPSARRPTATTTPLMPLGWGYRRRGSGNLDEERRQHWIWPGRSLGSLAGVGIQIEVVMPRRLSTRVR
jgi:hypothetical protein